MAVAAPLPPLEQLDGQVVRIFLRQGDFVVAEFLASKQGEVKIVGELTEIEEGQKLSLYGYEVEHPQYGPQFRVEYYHTLLERSRQGIIAFLKNEVSGVGPALARRIVDHFWPLHSGELLERLEADPEQLRQVAGIGADKATRIAQSLHENFSVRRIMLTFYEMGLTPALARRIIRAYDAIGEDPIKAVRARPYDLIRVVDGVGFVRADAIARAQGMPIDHPERMIAATEHTLSQATRAEGHCALPRKELAQRTVKLLWPERPPRDGLARATEVVNAMVEHTYLFTATLGGMEVVYPAETWYSERDAARILHRLLSDPLKAVSLFEQDATALREAAEARAGVTLAPGQARAFQLALEHGVVVITGGPGTGKSTLAKLLVDTFKRAGLKLKQGAPTGRAARRLAEVTGEPATTLHRLLEWQEGSFQRDEDRPLEAEVVLVDEVSMLDIFLARDLLRAVPPGCRLVLIGDVDQLPAVGAGNVLHDLIASNVLPVARLDRIFRQDTSRPNMIVELAHTINNAPAGGRVSLTGARSPGSGNVFVYDISRGLARCACGSVRDIARCPVCGAGSVVERFESPAAAGGALIEDLVVNRIPRTFGVESGTIQVLAPTYRGPMGVEALNERLRARLNPEDPRTPSLRLGERTFRPSDRVMATRNLPDRDVVNGLMGVITAVDPEEEELKIAFEGDVMATFNDEVGDFLTHAYAVTVHKSQGSEYPIVLLALDTSAPGLLYRQLLYTAITRAKAFLILVADPNAFGRAVANNRPRQRWTGLATWLREKPGEISKRG